MAHVWHGADPTEVVDAAEYELGTVMVALGDVTLDGLRIWSPASAETRTGREGHVWTVGGTLLATVDMPDTLTSGWTEHPLDTPVDLVDGDYVVVSYETSGNYGRVSNAFQAGNHVALDSQAMFPQSVAVPDGNGRFTTTPGTLPASTFQSTFYGVDAVYTPATPEVAPEADPIPGRYANTDLVAVAWLGGVPGLSAGMVATTLPRDNSTWAASGFVTAATVAGDPGMYVPMRRPVVQVDCWACKPGSGRPPWGRAAQLAELVYAATLNSASTPRELVLLDGYPHARVHTAVVLSEPRRLYGDDASYAQVQFDMELNWTEVAVS